MQSSDSDVKAAYEFMKHALSELVGKVREQYPGGAKGMGQAVLELSAMCLMPRPCDFNLLPKVVEMMAITGHGVAHGEVEVVRLPPSVVPPGANHG